MVHDSLHNFGAYFCLHPQFADALAFMENHGETLKTLLPGSYEINSSGAFASVSEYETKPESEGFLEYHRRFIDIQILLQGREAVGTARRENCRDNGYEEDKDLGRLEGAADFITLDTGNFAVFFPQDGHMPQISCAGGREKVRKIVFKIPVML